MRQEYTPLDLLPHAALARYYAYDFLRHPPEPPRRRRPRRLRPLLGRLMVHLGERLQGQPRIAAQPELQGCG